MLDDPSGGVNFCHEPVGRSLAFESQPFRYPRLQIDVKAVTPAPYFTVQRLSHGEQQLSRSNELGTERGLAHGRSQPHRGVQVAEAPDVLF